MNEEEKDWRRELRQDLGHIVSHFTTERYPVVLETQRTYQESLNLLEQRYAERLDHMFEGARGQYDEQYRLTATRQLDAAESLARSQAKTHEDLWAFRAGQRGDREALDPETGSYKQSKAYRDGYQELVDDRTRSGEQMDLAFRQVEDGLDARFGFDRLRERERNNDRDR